MKIKKTKQEILNLIVTKYNTLANNYNYYVSHEGFDNLRRQTSAEIQLLYFLLSELLEVSFNEALLLLTINQDKLLEK